MPWKRDESGQWPTLGWQVADWIESRCAIPDREFAGEPFLLTDEQLRFLLRFYRLDPRTGGFVYYRGAQLTRPQKWGKGPFSAAIICAEAEGPVRFERWDSGVWGGVVGRAVPTPLIQVTAVSEDQTDNVYSALLPMIELGALHAEIDDTGLGRINLPSGGKIEPVTASGRSRLGQRTTFVLQDQTESWLQSNGGRTLADNQRRNIAGMGGRWLSTPNAWDPTEESVAQYTAENERDGVYHDDVDPPAGLSIRNKRERRRALRTVYGDSATGARDGKSGAIEPWVDLDRIEAEVEALLPRDPEQAERWFLNRKRAEAGAAFDIARWRALADASVVVPDGSLATIGVDGARNDDALAVIGTDVEQAHQFVIGIWEVPPHAPEDYEHPLDEVDAAVSEIVDRLEMWRMYIDPQYIEPLVERWQGRWGQKRVIRWETNRRKQMAHAIRRYTDAQGARDLTHDGDEDMARHIANARKRKIAVRDSDHRPMWLIEKDKPMSPRKIDGASAGTLSWEARGDAVAAGAEAQQNYRTAGFS